MRQGFDLLTLIGWRNWWQHKFSFWGYCHIWEDTRPHFICLFKGHQLDQDYVPVAERVHCGRCYCFIRAEKGRKPNV